MFPSSIELYATQIEFLAPRVSEQVLHKMGFVPHWAMYLKGREKMPWLKWFSEHTSNIRNVYCHIKNLPEIKFQNCNSTFTFEIKILGCNNFDQLQVNYALKIARLNQNLENAKRRRKKNWSNISNTCNTFISSISNKTASCFRSASQRIWYDEIQHSYWQTIIFTKMKKCSLKAASWQHREPTCET